jgi:hypothetical protein
MHSCKIHLFTFLLSIILLSHCHHTRVIVCILSRCSPPQVIPGTKAVTKSRVARNRVVAWEICRGIWQGGLLEEVCMTIAEIAWARKGVK